MPKDHIICGLDIGSANVRIVQCKLDSISGRLQVIGASTVPSFGIRKGVVLEIDEVVSCISNCIEKVERISGIPIAEVVVGIGGSHIESIWSKGTVAVSRPQGEIAESDVVRVVDSSQAIQLPPNREILHVLPRSFTLDGQSGIKDPIGMSGIRLEVDTVIVHAGTPFIKNLTKAVMQAGLVVKDVVALSIASSFAVLNKQNRELGVCMLDLGAGTTNLAIYEESSLLHTAVIPIGGINITNDIAIGLRCGIETAEKIKVEVLSSVSKDKQIDLSKFEVENNEIFPKSLVYDIIEARLEELCSYIEKELNYANRHKKLPAGFVVTGGGCNLIGLTEFIKRSLGLPIAAGAILDMDVIIQTANAPTYSGALGLCQWSNRHYEPKEINSFSGAMETFLETSIVLKLKKLYKSLLP